MNSTDVRVKPATELPWRYERTGGDGYAVHQHVWGPAVTIHSSADSEDVERDMRYIVHAVDAYPKLVAVLRQIAKPALGGKQQQYAAQAILRELGEL